MIKNQRLAVLLIFSLSLLGCPSSSLVPHKKTVLRKRFVLLNTPDCLAFQDRVAFLSFCVPSQTKMLVARKFVPTSQTSFETKMQIFGEQIELLLRNDQLASDLPEGALSAPWLLRYAEVYAQHRGVTGGLRKRQVLSRRHQKHLHVDAAIWTAFSIPQPNRYKWEEVLIFSQKRPATRYIISLRLTQQIRQNHPKLRRFMVALLKKMHFASHR